jgi:hypothetical protein
MSAPSIIETWEDEPSTGPYCTHCGWELERELCEQCDGEGLYGHDCGEDCCACLDPEENEPCGLCDGDGGWWVCENTECPAKKEK